VNFSMFVVLAVYVPSMAMAVKRDCEFTLRISMINPFSAGRSQGGLRAGMGQRRQDQTGTCTAPSKAVNHYTHGTYTNTFTGARLINQGSGA